MDQEVLEQWLVSSEADRLTSGKPVGISGFFANKINEFKGLFHNLN
jgi:hypothetical protein